jgi:hypothetical protein
MSSGKYSSDFLLIGLFSLEAPEIVTTPRPKGGSTKHFAYQSCVSASSLDDALLSLAHPNPSTYQWYAATFRVYAGRDEPLEDLSVVFAVARGHAYTDTEGEIVFDLDVLLYYNAGIGTPSSNPDYFASLPSFGSTIYYAIGTSTGPLVAATDGTGRELEFTASSYVFNQTTRTKML